jgi:hypothetical protein
VTEIVTDDGPPSRLATVASRPDRPLGRRRPFEGDVADLVDDQQRQPSQSAELVMQPAGGMGGSDPVDPLGGGGEGDAVAGLAGPDR